MTPGRRVLWALAAAVSGLAAYVYFSSPPPSSLTENLTTIGEYARIEAEFDRRVKARFQTGGLEKDLVDELRRQGFGEEAASADGERSLGRRMGGFPVCNESAIIRWRSDAAGRLTAVRGVYSAVCL